MPRRRKESAWQHTDWPPSALLGAAKFIWRLSLFKSLQHQLEHIFLKIIVVSRAAYYSHTFVKGDLKDE